MESVIKKYCLEHYTENFKEPNKNLKYHFIVPGGGYTILWDWDSWLTNIATKQFVKDDVTKYERGCILNFLNMINDYGNVPVTVGPDSNPWPVSDNPGNCHKPCLVQHAAFLIKCDNGDAEWLRADYEKLCRFVDYYMRFFRHENGLYFWRDDNAIGVDNDPCTFYRPKCSSASILINCFMYKELEGICYIGNCLGVDTAKYKAEQENLKNSIQELLWDEKDGSFYSADLNLLPIDTGSWLHQGAPRHWDSVIERMGVWSNFLPMWCGIATPEQAERMVKENLLDEKAFWAPYGVRTLSKYEKMYTVAPTNNPSCWLGPIWGVSNYMVFSGLVKYGFTKEATELAEKTVKLFTDDINKTGCMHEFYDPETGEPQCGAGFQNWNMLSIIMEDWLKGEDVIHEF